MDKYSLFLSVFVTVIGSGLALECFTCENQDSNRDKCIKTTKQCEQFQDSCTTYVRWGVPPYWTPRGDRIYFISKDCDTQQGCERRQAATRTACKRDWYLDWACVECCTGDLCNYYVTLDGHSVRPSILITAVTLIGLFFMKRLA